VTTGTFSLSSCGASASASGQERPDDGDDVLARELGIAATVLSGEPSVSLTTSSTRLSGSCRLYACTASWSLQHAFAEDLELSALRQQRAEEIARRRELGGRVVQQHLAAHPFGMAGEPVRNDWLIPTASRYLRCSMRAAASRSVAWSKDTACRGQCDQFVVGEVLLDQFADPFPVSGLLVRAGDVSAR